MNAQEIVEVLSCGQPGCTCGSRSGDGWKTHCPAHADSTPSLQISEKNGKILVKCFGGCKQDAVIEALRSRNIWPISEKGKKHRSSKTPGKGRNGGTPPGLTLKELAEAKGFRIDGPKGLTAWSVSQAKYQGGTAVRISYFSPDGQEVAVRYRKALSGDNRFSWRKGDRVCLYGLGRKPRDWYLLVEGETDCWTAWVYDLPALGLPGASTWKAAWKEHFGDAMVYLWAEPDEAGQALPAKIGQDLPGLMVIQAPEGIKDLNEAHVKGEDIPALVERLKAAAIPAASIIKAQADKRLSELQKVAAPVLAAADPLQKVQRALRVMGFGGDLTPALITYLSVTSRLLAMRPGAMPVHLLLFGQASAGKSYVLLMVLRLFPEAAYHTISAGSPRVLIHDDSELRHRAVIFGESDSLPAGEDNPAASAIRNLLQDHHLHYDVTVRDPDTSQFTVKKVRKEGPSVLLTTSTRHLGYQLETRLFILEVEDSAQKIAAALETQAEIEESGEVRAADEALVAFQDFLQAQAPWDVKVPFVKPLSALIAPKATAPRILRDFARLLSLVKSAAVVRQAHRQRDNKGRLIANLDDYTMVFNLVGPMYEATLTGATKELRDVVQAVEEMLNSGKQVTATTLASRLKIGRATASRRVNATIKRGWIVNKETKRGQPWDLAMGEPLPEQEGLPTPDEVWDRSTLQERGETLNGTPQDVNIIDYNEQRSTVLPFTGDIRETIKKEASREGSEVSEGYAVSRVIL